MRLIDADKLIEVLRKNSIFRTVTNAEDKSVIEIIEEQPIAYDLDKFKQKLIDKWEKKLSMLDKEYINNLRDKTTIKERKFKKHMKLITRINELEMCIKDLKQLGGEINEDKENR